MEKNLLVNYLFSGLAIMISLISLIWNIVNSILSKIAKINVETPIFYRLSADSVRGVQEMDPVISLIATNIGTNTRYIKKIVIQCSKTIVKGGIESKEVQYISGSHPIKFPIEIQVGKEFQYEYNLVDFYNEFSKHLKEKDKFKFVITDTHGKKYSSRNNKFEEVLLALGISIS